MANNIIITKLSNGNIIVDNGVNEFKLTGNMLVYKDVESDSCIVKAENGSIVENFKVVDVLKVVRADATEVSISDLDVFFSELSTFFFFKLNGFSPAHRHLGNFTNYTDLTTQFPTADVGNLAYVEVSEGTKWLPGVFGGTFYSKGTYLWNGSNWDSAVNEISEALEDSLPILSAVDPTVNDDSGDGYKNGKNWINTTSDNVFVLTDNTLGAAVWVQTTGISAHKDTHKSGGSDEFTATDLLEAIVKRLKESGGATLLMGAVEDGKLLQRIGTSIVGYTPVITCCTFGAKSDTIGRFLVANGKSSDADENSKTKTRQPIIEDGTLTRLAYQTKNGTTSTQMKIHVNGTVEATVILISMNANKSGVETISVSVTVGDYVEIEYDASDKPGECTMYFKQELP